MFVASLRWVRLYIVINTRKASIQITDYRLVSELSLTCHFVHRLPGYLVTACSCCTQPIRYSELCVHLHTFFIDYKRSLKLWQETSQTGQRKVRETVIVNLSKKKETASKRFRRINTHCAWAEYRWLGNSLRKMIDQKYNKYNRESLDHIIP